MRAIDTNVVVRFLTNDDPHQGGVARAVIEDGDVFIPTTVLLETEWVLRSAYDFTAKQIVRALRGLAGLPGVTVSGSYLRASQFLRLSPARLSLSCC